MGEAMGSDWLVAEEQKDRLTGANFEAVVMEFWDSVPRSVMEAQISYIRGKGDEKG